MRKNTVKHFKMLDAADASSNQTSAVVNVLNLDQASIHLGWTGAGLAGTVTVEVRNGDLDPWYVLDMGGTISIAGVSGDHQLLFDQMPFTDIRLQYTTGGGTGSLTAALTMKTVGA